ncbi:AraC family transcriptional regulator [Bacillus horti]|uniref:AraC family transcriptional regulator n=1 Tax=Caldalkalibacillus horti TaxID=77523 RepID=A0ABT9VYW9_9BACI|nr:AraC family transcriptional regulator [Bacillus horti]MDQ0166169.1 AraC family transcriptional regulator [Bacillus horti]
MELLNKLNKAISYIEENLDAEISYKEAARLAHCSEHHFKRMFPFIAGVTLSEYIRRRRLTLAALELKDHEVRVIDVAVKYGYHSADAFSRAFHSLHGVTPTAARQSDVSLKAFPRMSFQMSIKGDAELNYRIVQKESFIVTGVKEEMNNEDGHFDPQVLKGDGDELYHELEELANTSLSGILHVTANMTDESYDYYLAVATTKKGPEYFATLSIPATTWAVFDAVGPAPETMLNTWERVHTEWFPTSGYELTEAPEFVRTLKEHEEKCEIWIPVARKSN